MPRQGRIEYAGAIYHVMSRGNRRPDLYLEDVDRQDLLKTLAPAPAAAGLQTLPLRVRPSGILVLVCIDGSKPPWVRLDAGPACAREWVKGQGVESP